MGYGAKDNPVPWLGPQAWIKEVHWPNKKSINVTVALLATANNLVVSSSNCVATHVIPPGGVSTGYILKSLVHYAPPSGWPRVEDVDTDPGTGISIPDDWYPPPRVVGGRTARPGDDSPDGDNTDPIREDEVVASGLPTYPTQGGVAAHGAWVVGAHGFVVEEPTGPYVDFRPTGVSNPTTRFRKGTDFQVKVWARKYTGPPLCYGGVVGDPGGVTAAVLGPGDWESWTAAGDINIDFAGAEFTYKNRKYKPVARYVEGPYGKAKTTDPRYGFSFQLLCEVQKD